MHTNVCQTRERPLLELPRHSKAPTRLVPQPRPYGSTLNTEQMKPTKPLLEEKKPKLYHQSYVSQLKQYEMANVVKIEAKFLMNTQSNHQG